MFNSLIVIIFIIMLSPHGTVKTPDQRVIERVIKSVNFHGPLIRTLRKKNKRKITHTCHEYYTKSQLPYDWIDWIDWIVLKGKSDFSAIEHHYIFKNINGDIKTKIDHNNENNQHPLMPKDLLVIKNNYLIKLTYFIKHSIYTMDFKLHRDGKRANPREHR
ncbi:hypothetical protein [Xenorhabdus koppenhoeferi]|uniref:Uncharacterized protein n=1 Tax=Xenorhabdus koppenhoeferi TaxID=351659 RepID=A0A1I7GVC2_9GAMM|nr:hypothetical protein [Xenorhabdus koppenhoeferi]SFU52390.1 hypothetical protein SAMN05421784_11023 [Xenorhabdus koppenhoeferi]